MPSAYRREAHRGHIPFVLWPGVPGPAERTELQGRQRDRTRDEEQEPAEFEQSAERHGYKLWISNRNDHQHSFTSQRMSLAFSFCTWPSEKA